jgi:hypothetical protein
MISTELMNGHNIKNEYNVIIRKLSWLFIRFEPEDKLFIAQCIW